MNSKYKVNTIPQNLSKNETIIQIADMIEHLSLITDDIFKVITNRLESNFEKLSLISDRIEVVDNKINNLKGAKKATQVFSSCKYPATLVNREYVSIFSNSNAPSLPRREIQQRGASSTYEPIDKLQFYHVRVPNNQENAVSNEGLGEWPSDLENINDLLLFNSGRNLYENFIISDPLIGGPQVKNNENVDVSNIGAAPLSITERSSLARTSNQNYFYSPTIGEVPELDVPLDLPDLPGVADNVRYSEIEALADSIAPSATVSKPPDFPRIVPNVEIEIIDVAELPPVTNDSDADVYIPPDVILMPPPPPLPQVKVENPKIIEQAEQITPKVVVEKMEPIDRLIDNGNNNLLLQMRSNLMESIRNAGGTKKLRPVQGNKGKKKQVSPPSMDLMADLHSKLQMRRKGISGTKAQQNASFSGDSTFNKISAMIPSPREKNEESTGSESEDWQ